MFRGKPRSISCSLARNHICRLLSTACKTQVVSGNTRAKALQQQHSYTASKSALHCFQHKTHQSYFSNHLVKRCNKCSHSAFLRSLRIVLEFWSLAYFIHKRNIKLLSPTERQDEQSSVCAYHFALPNPYTKLQATFQLHLIHKHCNKPANQRLIHGATVYAIALN